MKRNLDTWAADGEKKVERHAVFDLTAPEIGEEVDRVLKECDGETVKIYGTLCRFFLIGIEAGYRMRKCEERKKGAK